MYMYNYALNQFWVHISFTYLVQSGLTDTVVHNTEGHLVLFYCLEQRGPGNSFTGDLIGHDTLIKVGGQHEIKKIKMPIRVS